MQLTRDEMNGLNVGDRVVLIQKAKSLVKGARGVVVVFHTAPHFIQKDAYTTSEVSTMPSDQWVVDIKVNGFLVENVPVNAIKKS